ncbi:zinc ABC transporter substrate-binding protein [Tateyamaria omphalii]|uniref:zinc ABC transporter substrate-binding protein n=1 Tax=Tateyamaria omphalii TaxID=299262 RepID=UPI001C990A9A|nr:zinc ABC transporter substrate-binding protein [Tateyamaria omphalii]MBY5933754.1 zinc ABC transporter substrate-binding protein [Tateyamaria omphalii]
MSRKLPVLSTVAVLMGGAAWADVPNVAVDIAPVHSLVARVMDGVGTPALIVPPGASPHEYNLRPSEAQALQDADVVFWVGEDLTPWLEGAVETLAENAAVLALLEAQGTTLLDFREDALFEAHVHGDEKHGEDAHEDHAHDDHDGHDHDEHDHDGHGEGEHAHDDHAHEEHGHAHEEHDHAHGDHGHGDEYAHDDHDAHDHDKDEAHAHGAHDPHAWLSLENADLWLNLIAAKLASSDPDNLDTYFANATAARADIAALKAEINAALDPVRGGRFIVFHDAYQYFEASFDMPASGAISLSDATDPSPARIAEIQGRIREEGIDCVLAEPQFNSGLVATVLDGTQAQTGVIDPLGAALEPGADLYPQLIRNMAETLADCL